VVQLETHSAAVAGLHEKRFVPLADEILTVRLVKMTVLPVPVSLHMLEILW